MFLATSDLHVTDRERDKYRWDIFPWLRMHARNRGVKHIGILGDITDLKDKHSSRLINRLIDELAETSELAKVWILRGNHDYVDPNEPYLRFLQHFPKKRVQFIMEPTPIDLDGTSVLAIPNMKRWQVNSNWMKKTPFNAGHQFLWCHQTFQNARASNGMKLPGIPINRVSMVRTGGARVISGDIHVPQEIGNVVYCGAPHPVTFGDTYKPRVLFYDGEILRSIPRSTIRKISVRIKKASELDEMELSPGDQIKIEYALPREKFYQWEKRKAKVVQKLTEMQVEVVSVEIVVHAPRKVSKFSEDLREETEFKSDKEMFEAFCAARNIGDEFRQTGSELL